MASLSTAQTLAKLLGQTRSASEVAFKLAARICDHAADGCTPQELHKDLMDCGMGAVDAAAVVACFRVDPGSSGKTIGDAAVFAATLIDIPAGFLSRLLQVLPPEHRPTG